MFIDCHTHAFSDKIAEKAVAQLINYYNIPTKHGGRLSDLFNVANKASLDGLILLVAATKPEQVKPANDWVLELKALSPEQLKSRFNMEQLPQITHFGTFHPKDPDWPKEINRLRAAGIKGIKLHPEFQGINLGNPALNNFFEEITNDFILMVHVGDPVVSTDNLSTPAKVAHINANFPHLKIIAAHLGGYQLWKEAYEVLVGREVYLDTSSSLSYIDQGLLRKIITKHGTDKILFGSDYPLKSPQEELELFDQINWLSAAEKEKILGVNCAALLGLI